MPQLLGIQVNNFKGLADVTLGQVRYRKGDPLPRFMCFVGPNGSGKSSVLDVFSFVSDCLREGVEAACDKPHRGGFERLRTQNQTGPMRFTLYFKQAPKARPITYSFAIDLEDGLPIVVSETLLQGRSNQTGGQPYRFLYLDRGAGEAWPGQGLDGDASAPKVPVTLDDPTKLGITVLGQLKEHERITGLRSYIEGWYLSYFVPELARRLPMAGAQKHLDRTGENLGNYLQYLQRSNPQRFERVLAKVQAQIPGIEHISWEMSQDKRILIKFDEAGYLDPFYQNSMSDGTLKLFAYMLLLEDPDPFPFIGIEEPENGLYHKVLFDLARAFRDHADKGDRTQLLVTTHSPQFVDALQPDEVWLVEKARDGTVVPRRTSDIPAVADLVREGIPLGNVWFSNHFQERGFVG